jgi:hypothetical protein
MASEKSKEIPTEKLGDLSLEKSGGMFLFMLGIIRFICDLLCYCYLIIFCLLFMNFKWYCKKNYRRTEIYQKSGCCGKRIVIEEEKGRKSSTRMDG